MSNNNDRLEEKHRQIDAWVAENGDPVSDLEQLRYRQVDIIGRLQKDFLRQIDAYGVSTAPGGVIREYCESIEASCNALAAIQHVLEDGQA